MSSSESPIKCEYQPDTDSVLIYQSGRGGIKVVDVPAAELRAVLPKAKPTRPVPYYPPGARSVMPNIVKPSLFDRFRRS